MQLGEYHLLAPLRSGPDGQSYRAETSGGTAVEVRTLTAARRDPVRWATLVKRLRAATLLREPAALQIVGLALESESPHFALVPAERTSFREALGRRGPLLAEELARLTAKLARALAEAHRLGLTFGRSILDHCEVSRGPNSTPNPVLDFTGANVDSNPASGPLWTDPTEDVAELGRLLRALRAGGPSQDGLTTGAGLAGDDGQTVCLEGDAAYPDPFARITEQLLAPDPADRPTAAEAARRLEALACSSPTLAGVTAGEPINGTSEFNLETSAVPPVVVAATAPVHEGRARLVQTLSQGADAVAGRTHLGRFKLLEKLGQGGMGAVYRAEDITDGSPVAVKVLRADWALRPEALRRFHKEARLLAEVTNPYVANLLEVNEDDGIHYLALEFVPGQSLQKLLDAHGRLDERAALTVIADVCRALADAHRRGIVHRDIKPENILVQVGGQGTDLSAQTWKVKLSDFGLARHVIESDSLSMTRAGAVLGTPYYMSPEQASGKGVDVRTDVYALGATLFHLLAGRPPFVGETPLAVIHQHCKEPPPPLQRLRPEVSDGVALIVEKALAKAPEVRYADASALLGDIERLLRGEPTSIAVHPRLPPCDPKSLIQYDWSWELEASPEQLWPHVSNTERLNKAVGLPAVQFTAQVEDREEGSELPAPLAPRVRRFGQFRKAGLTAAWEEHPFEWIEARRFGVLREYSRGPFKWLVSIVELQPRAGGGALLFHRVRIEPNGLLGRTVAAVEVNLKGRRAVERVYRRIDAALTGKLGGPTENDPFEPPASPSAARRQRIEQLVGRLSARGVDPSVAELLGEFITYAPEQAVARIRPLALAERLGVDPQEMVAACLHGAREGLLVLLWDLLCPLCRIPSQVQDTLKALQDHGHCEACNLNYELDFAGSVEMIFKAHPSLRDCEAGVYCIGGPAHSPHVVAQVRVAAGERIDLDLALPEGAYRLRGPQLPYQLDFVARTTEPRRACEIRLSRGEIPKALQAGQQVMTLVNDFDQEVLVRLERTAPRHDALTAARASALALFRELFPDEVLAPGQLVSIATTTLLATELGGAARLYAELGDARAFEVVHDHLRRLDDVIRREGGALVKTVGEGVLAAFADPLAAARAALACLESETRAGAGAEVRMAVHCGTALAVTLNDHLDYFGATVTQLWQLLREAPAGGLVVSDAVVADAGVAAHLAERGVRPAPLEMFPGVGLSHLVRPAAARAARTP